MTRRLWLQALLLGPWGRAASAAHRIRGGVPGTTPGRAQAANPAAPSPPPLSAEETDTLISFAEVLVQDRRLAPDERRYLAAHIKDWAVSIPDQLAHYRTAARLLDRLAGKPFSRLAIPERVELLDRYRLGTRAVPVGHDPEPIAADARAVRSRVVPALIEGYWSSPAGWAAVGYEVFPGRCGDLTRYTRPEA